MSTAVFEPGADVTVPGTVVTLDSTPAADASVAGAKAASLARALRAGLPVLPGWVITTGAFAPPASGATLPVEAELRAAWAAASTGGTRPVVVRSSSTVEDGRTSSMAGRFTSVLGVGDWPAFRRAVDVVLASAKVVSGAPMAVLVQPQLTTTVGGVLFGVDPVSGRTDRVVVAASDEGPAAIVGGAVAGSRYVLSRRRVVEGPAHGPLSHNQMAALRALAQRTAEVFGGPQDVEWGFGEDGRLYLLQSRPVTAAGAAAATGPVLGPGPVAETFPEPLSPLEADLWVEPLRTAMRSALALAGTTPKRRLALSPVVTTVGGRVVADLGLLDAGARPASLLARIDPRPPVRRLVAAWRVGRLRAALPALAGDLVVRLDADLLAVGAVDTLADAELLGLLERSAQGLVALHGHEVLVGWLVPAAGTGTVTAASVALQALAGARAAGLADDEIVLRHPSVLALVPPRIGAGVALPAVDAAPAAVPVAAAGEPDPAALLREALRLRARWLQELTARAAWELGERLAGRGLLTEADDVRALRLTELAEAVRAGVAPAGRSNQPPIAPSLPARFRLAADGAVVPTPPPSRRGRRAGHTGGTGAGGGRGTGPVHGGSGPPDAGAVLVVRTLDPTLAPLLPRLGGLVAETGSVLSHLAILARELGVPTAVGVEDALSRFPFGAMVTVDGTTGEVSLIDEHRKGAA